MYNRALTDHPSCYTHHWSMQRIWTNYSFFVIALWQRVGKIEQKYITFQECIILTLLESLLQDYFKSVKVDGSPDQRGFRLNWAIFIFLQMHINTLVLFITHLIILIIIQGIKIISIFIFPIFIPDLGMKLRKHQCQMFQIVIQVYYQGTMYNTASQ